MSTWRQNTEPSLIITEIPLLQALWSHFPDLDWSFVGHREKSDQAAPETVLLKALPIPSSIGIRAVSKAFSYGALNPSGSPSLTLPPCSLLPFLQSIGALLTLGTRFHRAHPCRLMFYKELLKQRPVGWWKPSMEDSLSTLSGCLTLPRGASPSLMANLKYLFQIPCPSQEKVHQQLRE